MPTSAREGTAVTTGHLTEAEHLGPLRQPSVQLSRLSEGRISCILAGFFKELNDMINMTGPTRKDPVSLSLGELNPPRGKNSLFLVGRKLKFRQVKRLIQGLTVFQPPDSNPLLSHFMSFPGKCL